MAGAVMVGGQPESKPGTLVDASADITLRQDDHPYVSRGALAKPQFEVGRELVGKGGVVRDEIVRRGAVEKIRTWAAAHALIAGPDVESPITGPAGNVEYLLLLRTT